MDKEPVAPASQAPLEWQESLAGQLKQMGRWMQGRFVIQPDPSDEVVHAERFLDADYLRHAIARAATTTMHSPTAAPVAEDEADIDLRIAVSRFTRHYSGSLSIAALVALARGVGLDLSPARCRLIIRNDIPFQLVFDASDDDLVSCSERTAGWPAGGPTFDTIDELREYVWRNLYAVHLAPLFERVLTVTTVSPTLMWSNAAEWVGMISDAADEYLDPAGAEAFVDDREALFGADRIPGIAGPNPMQGLLRWEPFDAEDFPRGVQVRKMCCITYLLPDRLGRLCQNCGFLPLPDRVALIRERHGVPVGGPPGPAELRSIEIGLEKLGVKS